MRKGYMHAIEGILAGLLVVIYMSSMIQPPDVEDWTRTSLQKRSGDIISTLQRSGVLDRSLTDDDIDKVRATVGALGGGMNFDMEVNGFPPGDIAVRLGIKPDDIEIVGYGASGGSWSASFAGEGFQVEDIDDDARFETVSFDFDSDSTYEAGPFTTGEMVAFPKAMDVDHRFVIGSVNRTVTFYNVTQFNRIITQESFSRGGLTFTPSYTALPLDESRNITSGIAEGNSKTLSWFGAEVRVERVSAGELEFVERVGGTDRRTKGPFTVGEEVNLFGRLYTIESISNWVTLRPRRSLTGDVFYLEDVSPKATENELRPLVEDFIDNEGTVIEATDMSRISIDGSFHEKLGLESLSLDIAREGIGGAVMHDGGPGTPGEQVARYLEEGEMVIPESRFDLSTNDNYADTTLTMGANTDVNVNVSLNQERIEDMDFFRRGKTIKKYDISVGDSVFLVNNSYRVLDQYPLRMEMASDHIFGNMWKDKLTGEHTVMKMEGWSWDAAGQGDNETLGSGSAPDLPTTSCGGSDPDPDYRYGSVTIGGDSYDVALTNIPPCGEDWEYLNIELSNDDFYANSSSETDSEDGREGIYTTGDEVLIDGNEYEVTTANDISFPWVALNRTVPSEVGVAFWNEDVLASQGDYVYIGNRTFSDDEVTAIQSMFIHAATEKRELTPETIIGEPNIGTTVVAALSDRVYVPYLIDSIWWFQ